MRFTLHVWFHSSTSNTRINFKREQANPNQTLSLQHRANRRTFPQRTSGPRRVHACRDRVSPWRQCPPNFTKLHQKQNTRAFSVIITATIQRHNKQNGSGTFYVHSVQDDSYLWRWPASNVLGACFDLCCPDSVSAFHLFPPFFTGE